MYFHENAQGLIAICMNAFTHRHIDTISTCALGLSVSLVNFDLPYDPIRLLGICTTLKPDHVGNYCIYTMLTTTGNVKTCTCRAYRNIRNSVVWGDSLHPFLI